MSKKFLVTRGKVSVDIERETITFPDGRPYRPAPLLARILAAIVPKDHPVSTGEIARRIERATGIPQSAKKISPVMGRLEKRGWVMRGKRGGWRLPEE